MNPSNPGQSINPIAPRKALERCIGASTKVRKIVLAVHSPRPHSNFEVQMVAVVGHRRRRDFSVSVWRYAAQVRKGKVETRIGNHTFRATGITAYLKNSGKLEVAQQIANHESPRTTKLYDRRQDEISLDEIERIAI